MLTSTILRGLSLFIVLASGLGCGAPPPVEHPASLSLSFRPTSLGSTLWIATPFAVEVTTEREARALEALDPMYVGELGASGGQVRRSSVAAVAAERGATHFRFVTGGDELRVDIVLYRVDPDRWSKLPTSLRPLSASL